MALRGDLGDTDTLTGALRLRSSNAPLSLSVCSADDDDDARQRTSFG